MYLSFLLLQDMPPPEVVNEGLAYRLLILIAAIVVAYITRFFLIRGMKKRMMIESKKAGPAPKEDNPHVRPAKALSIKEKSADLPFPRGRGHTEFLSERGAKRPFDPIWSRYGDGHSICPAGDGPGSDRHVELGQRRADPYGI